jgi:3-oxoacyl-[acyl-carrier protein] reductase
MTDLKAKSRTVLISGASKGIGRSLAERLTAQGHAVIGIARTQDDTFPGRLVTVDLSDRAATSAALQEISSSSRVDAVVNNVGLIRPQLLDDITLDALDAVLDLNLRTAIQLTQAALPSMRKQGWGRVVNVASLVALGAPAKRTAYAAAKAALISAARVWALELASTGITVNVVAPGPIETELFRENNPPGSEGEIRYRAMVPMGHLGRPEDIAAAIAFLLSEEASFITGQTIFVDGGASIGRQLI